MGGEGARLIELARFVCPECGAEFDVWLDDGRPEIIPLCPSCYDDGRCVVGRVSLEEEGPCGFDLGRECAQEWSA